MPPTKEPTYLIVLTLRDGRNFPFNAHEQIIAEAKFGTNTLTTDPKKYEVAPHFDEELCWSTTPRALHDHKLRRTPIKITAYGWDARTAKRQQIGYVTLDIRSHLTRDRFEWHSLVGVPYMREKPELQLSIKCEEDDVKPTLSGIPANLSDYSGASPTTSGSSPIKMNKTRSAAAHTTHQLSTALSRNTNFMPPPPPSLTVASSSSSIASSAVRLQRLQATADSVRDRSRVEADRKSLTRSSSHASSLGSLARKNQRNVGEADNTVVNIPESRGSSRPPSSSGTFDRRNTSTNDNRLSVLTGENFDRSHDAKSTSGNNHAAVMHSTSRMPPVENEGKSFREQATPFPAQQPTTAALRPKLNDADNASHHYCCTINLFSIALTSSQVRKNVFVYARYTYSFFGTSSPIITRPSVEVPPRNEKRFNNGYCSFSFACTSVQQHRAFECVPLTVEIYSTSTASRDVCIGVTKIPLATLLQQPKNQTFFNNNEQEIVFRQQYDGTAEIVDVVNEETQQPLGRLHYKLCMDDYGPLQDGGVGMPAPMTAEHERYSVENHNNIADETLTEANHADVPNFDNSQHRQQPHNMPMTNGQTAMSHASVNGYDLSLPPPSLNQPHTSGVSQMLFAQTSNQQQFRYGNSQVVNHSMTPVQPPPSTTNVYSQAARFGNELYQNSVAPPNSAAHQNLYPETGLFSNSSVHNRAHAAGDVLHDMTSRRLDAPPPPSSFMPRAYTPPTRNELGRANPGGAGSNVTEHENLLVNELMKLRLQKMEMQAAMELEVWKEEEERKFSEYLKRKEQESLKILADEWRRRDKEREHLFDERRSAYEQQEAKLKDALDLVGTRERQLSDIEKELAFREQKLINERESLDAHHRETEDRISKTYEGKLENEKIITENLRRLLKENEERLGKVEKRVSEKEQECSDLRDKMAERPEHQLRSQMEILKVEKRELESRVREAMEQANHFKSQWSKAMADLHRVRGEERQSYDGRMKALSREVEQLKMALTKETRTMMSKRTPVENATSSGANHHQQNFDHDNAGQHETNSGAASADEQRRSRNSNNNRQQEEFYGASTAGGGVAGGARSAGSSSAYEESDGESVFSPNYRHSNQQQQQQQNPPTSSRRKQQQQSGASSKKYNADETDDEEMRARKQELLKLMDERNVLLKTGIYSPDDEMIRDLNKKVRELEVQLIDDGVSIPDA